MNLVINSKKMCELLSDFYNIARVRMVVFDVDFNHVAAYPEESCNFCRMMKSDHVSKKLCKESDRQACENCKKNDSFYMHKCHAGLIEVVAPVKMDDITLGYVMFGQVMDENACYKDILEYASGYTDDTGLEQAVLQLEKKSVEQIKSMSRLLEMCADYLWRNEYIMVGEGNNIIYRLSSYISNNIKKEITVEVLCRELGISRSRLYEVAHKYYGMSIAKYIRKKKTAIAASYLKEGYRVSEAAEAAGFYDYNYFSKIFRAEYGTTPQKFRKEQIIGY